MKKKIWTGVIAAVLLLALLTVPIPTGVYKDGGTREYTALTYTIVDWNRLTEDAVYNETRVYFFPDNFKSIDSLWQYEAERVEHRFVAEVLEQSGTSVLLAPIEGQAMYSTDQRFRVNTEELGDIGAKTGSFVVLTYTGGIMETYPAKVNAVKWELARDLRPLEYTESWLDRETAEKYDNNIFEHIVITEIYGNCFFARTVTPMAYTIKLNGQLSEDWCVGDQVAVTYENTYYDDKNQRVEVDLLTVAPSDFELDPYAAYKPVIYLYPERETEVSVKLLLDGKLTCTYPAYRNGWTVTATPDGSLTDAKGQTYNYLYWEGETNARWDMTNGFCVKGTDTAAFLEDALEKLGLNRREANEFIVYWLPLMQENPYNIISFQTDVYTEAAKLTVEPAPDTLIRVFMVWQASDEPVKIEAQVLSAPEREGFTVVEWGGTQWTAQ